MQPGTPAAHRSEVAPDFRSPPRVKEPRRAGTLGLVPAAAALLLAALGSCDSDPVVEPEPTLEIVPDSVTLTHIGHQFAFTVRGGEAVRWNSRDLAVFTVDADGTVTARGNGTAQVQAWTPESSDHALVRVRQLADVLEAFGEGQRAAAGLSLIEPVGVRVLDAGGAPVSGTTVRFEPGADDGTVEPREAQTDSAGVASARWTLGSDPGPYTLAISADDARVEITATALHPDEAVGSVEILSGEDQWAVAGHALPDPLSVRVTDEAGRPVRGASVRFKAEAGGGRADPGVTVTDSLGRAAAAWTLGPDPGAQRMAVMAGTVTLTFEASAVSDEGVCNRTPAVSAEIVRLERVGNCSEVTEEMLGGIVALHLDEKGIRQLRKGDFDGLVSMYFLGLGENELTELPPGIFEGLPGLRRLRLDDNELTQLPPGVFKGLSGLAEMNLWHNRLTELTPGTFSGLDALVRLRFDYNELTELPEDLFGGLSNLEFLTMRGNRLTSLPEGVFSGLSNLDDVSLAENQLTELPPTLLAETPALRRINLARNQLTTLPPDLFSGTPALQRLYLEYNRLETFPPDVFAQLQSLVRLNLSDNDLIELLPGIFSGTPKLTELSLEDNELAVLPPGLFAGLSELEWVRLHGNPGAPFAIRTEFVRVDGDLLAPGPARVAVRVPSGAPFAFKVPVSVQRGSISREVVSLLPGDTVSTPFDVSAQSDGVAAHLGFTPLPEVRVAGYEGLKLARGEELVLFAEADNRSPVARSTVPPHRLQAGGPSADLTLADYFGDPDGDSLAYTVATTESGVLAARIEDGVLWLDPVSVDTTEVEVTATDPDGLRATHRFRTWVVPAPDPDAFNIELYFDPGFTPEEEAAIRRAADRWMEAVTGDLPDVPVQGPLSEFCFDGPLPPRVVGVIDDLLIRMRWAAQQDKAAATATTCGARESGLTFLAENSFTLWYFRRPEPILDALYEYALHEIGHVLGFGYWVFGSSPKSWRELFRAADGDGHFAGPLAVAAFDAAGGEAYAGGKVPLEDRISVLNIHWRERVIPGDIMTARGDALLTAITLQALADLGYEVDVSKADPYTLPMAAQGDVRGDVEVESADEEVFADDVIRVPVVVVDRDGKVVRIIRP